MRCVKTERITNLLLCGVCLKYVWPLESGSFQKVIKLPPGGEMSDLSVACVSYFCREVSIIIGLIKIILKTNVVSLTVVSTDMH